MLLNEITLKTSVFAKLTSFNCWINRQDVLELEPIVLDLHAMHLDYYSLQVARIKSRLFLSFAK